MPSKKEKIKFIIIRTLGNFFILFSLWGMVMTFGPVFYLEFLYQTNKARNIKYVLTEKKQPVDRIEVKDTQSDLDLNNKTLFGQLTGGNKIEYISPVSAQFGIVIPKINANAPIYPNVDAGSPDIYLPVLQQGVAHAAGTVFPGVSGNIFLFAHSTDAFWNVGRYNAVFYLLKELESGDEIDVYFMGIRHVYRVVDKKVVNPSEVNYLTAPSPYEQLTLQTCWPPGTTFQRLLIFARPDRDLRM